MEMVQRQYYWWLSLTLSGGRMSLLQKTGLSQTGAVTTSHHKERQHTTKKWRREAPQLGDKHDIALPPLEVGRGKEARPLGPERLSGTEAAAGAVSATRSPWWLTCPLRAPAPGRLLRGHQGLLGGRWVWGERGPEARGQKVLRSVGWSLCEVRE